MQTQSWSDRDPSAPRTPWGKAQDMKVYGEGVVAYSTAGHGGFKLDRKRQNQVHPALRRTGCWYEEDCEWGIVAMTFPELFSEKDVAAGIRVIKEYYPDAYTAATGLPVALEDSYVLRRRKFELETLDNFVVGCCWGDWSPGVPVGHVVVLGKRASDDASAFFNLTAEEYQHPQELVLDAFPRASESMIPMEYRAQ